jgi:RNA polymerase sigma factor (sigma-70 family)
MDYKKYNDYELIYMVRENDDNSKSIMMNKYTPIIRKIASEYYQKYSNFGYEFDDFLQEAQYSFYQALSTYNEEKNSLFYTYVVMLIRRKLSSFCRKISGKRASSFYRDCVSFDNDDYEDIQSNIDYIYHNLNFQDIVHDVILSSSFLSGVILELRYNNFTFREISTLLDIPLTTTEYLGRKAKEQLELSIKKNYDNF